MLERAESLLYDERAAHREESDDSGDEYDIGGECLSNASFDDINEEMEFSTTCLIQLRPSLEQNLVYERKPDLDSAYPSPVLVPFSASAQYYVCMVLERYPRAENQLVERLGKANWQRHVDVRKRMKSIKTSTQEEAGSEFRTELTSHDSGLSTSIPTQTQYAQSHASSISSHAEGETGPVCVPAMPDEVREGKPFRCYFCGHLVSSIKNSIHWKSVLTKSWIRVYLI